MNEDTVLRVIAPDHVAAALQCMAIQSAAKSDGEGGTE
jgi:hypothetical protein